MLVPMTDLVPLRTTAAWPAFAKPEPLPHVYGRCEVPVVQYDQTRKFWLIADHAIAGVDSVTRDKKDEKAYAFRNGVDPSGHPVALLELASPLKEVERLTVDVRGKIDSDTGTLIENPADVLRDVLAMTGRAIPASSVSSFRSACADIRLAGVLSASLTIRAQIAEIAESVGMLWSTAMPGLAARYPSDRDVGDPLLSRYLVSAPVQVNAYCSLDRIYTEASVEHGWSWTDNRARQTALLESSAVATYGRRSKRIVAKWLTSTADAISLGTSFLQANARPRWTYSVYLESDPLVSPGQWFYVSDPLLPIDGEVQAISSELDWDHMLQYLKAEVSVGAVPSVSLVALGSEFDDAPSDLRITYADGIATLVVNDGNGAPIRDATVKLGDKTGKTDRTGTVRFKIDRGTYPFEIEATGYVKQTGEITV
jgi:hypothetical protein